MILRSGSSFPMSRRACTAVAKSSEGLMINCDVCLLALETCWQTVRFACLEEFDLVDCCSYVIS